MRKSAGAGRLLVLLGLLTVLGSCAKVPPEVVQLSSTLGEDIVATQTSYQLLITIHFDNLRRQVNTFIDTRWRPVFLKKFIKNGDLVGRATDPDPNAVLTKVGNWAQVAIEQIETKRKELLDPVDSDEKALQAAVDEAFNRMIRANTAITAHLNSIRKVKEFQDQILEKAGVKDLRDRINNALIAASDKTNDLIKKVEKADNIVTDLGNQIQ